jgi:hypothetical protein
LKRTGRLGDNGAIDAAASEKVRQQGGDHTTVGGFFADFRIRGPGNAGLHHAADGRGPARVFAGFGIQLVDFRADGMAQAAFDTFGFIGITRLAFGIQLQGAVVNGCAKGHAPAAAMAKPRFLDIFNQVGKGFHFLSCSVGRFARCPLSPL